MSMIKCVFSKNSLLICSICFNTTELANISIKQELQNAGLLEGIKTFRNGPSTDKLAFLQTIKKKRALKRKVSTLFSFCLVVKMRVCPWGVRWGDNGICRDSLVCL